MVIFFIAKIEKEVDYAVIINQNARHHANIHCIKTFGNDTYCYILIFFILFFQNLKIRILKKMLTSAIFVYIFDWSNKITNKVVCSAMLYCMIGYETKLYFLFICKEYEFGGRSEILVSLCQSWVIFGKRKNQITFENHVGTKMDTQPYMYYPSLVHFQPITEHGKAAHLGVENLVKFVY